LTLQNEKEIQLPHPYYVLHPATEKQMRDNGIKVDYVEMGLVDYNDFIKAKPPTAPITSKFTSATRIRNARRDREFIVWDERQAYVDPLGNVVPIKRINCGIYNAITVKKKTIPDPEVGTKEIVTDWKMIPLYEFEFKKEYADQIIDNAENRFEMFFYIMEERSNDRPRAFRENDFEKWRDWSFDSLYDFARSPRNFGTSEELKNRSLDPDLDNLKDQPERTHAEVFGTEEQRKAAYEQSKTKNKGK
jgi:hypothetical protein